MNKLSTKQNKSKTLNLWLHKGLIWLVIRIVDITNYAKSEAVGIVSLIIPVASLIISSILLLPYFQNILTNTQDLSAVYIASGALIGTILALIISLSILPIQKSVEILTPSFTKIYRTDKGLITVFLLLSFFCVMSFIFSVDGLLKIGNNYLLPIEIFIIGISIQCVRYYQNRVTHLLDPQLAVETFFVITKNRINRASRIINFLSWCMLLMEKRKENRKQQSDALKSELFRRSTIIADIINQIYEVSEISKKAIRRGENYLAEKSIRYLSALAIYYLKLRENNLSLALEDIMGVYGCDADNLVGPVYEELYNINKTATKNDCEEISQVVIQEYGKIAIVIGSLESEALKKFYSPISWKPISFIKHCIDNASKYNMREALLTGARTYSNISRSTTSETDQLTLINNLNNICIQYFLSGNALLVNEIVREMMNIGNYYIFSEKYHRMLPFKKLLENIKFLIPLGINFEKGSPEQLRWIPSEFPYNLENELSIGEIFRRSRSLIKPDENRNWISPYHKFIPIYKEIWRHFRDLGDTIDFKSSFILYHINQTILHICRISLSVLEEGEKKQWDTTKVHSCVQWLLSFYWTAFSKMSQITEYAAKEAADTLAKIGLHFHSSTYIMGMEITKNCASNIGSIAEQFILKNQKASAYNIADVYIKIVHIVEYVTALNQNEFAEIIQAEIKKPDSLEDEKWKDISAKIDHRKQQLQKRLQKEKYNSPIGLIHRSEGLLERLLTDLNKEE